MEEGAEGSQEGQTGPSRILTDVPTRRRSAAAEYAGATIVALWLSRSFWLPGRFVVAFDTVAYTGPNYAVTMDAWRSGRIPLWNEFIYGGITHAGNPQTAVFSPAKVLGLLFDTNRAMGVTVALHLVVMAVGTVALLRRLGARAPAGFAAALVMVANGAVLTRSIQFEQIVVLAWAPLLLTAITAVLSAERRPWLAMSGVGGVTAMVLVSGHPQTIYQLVVLAGAWALGIALRSRRWARVPDLAAGLAVGIVAATVHLAALVAGTRDSAVGAERTRDDDALRALAATPEHLAQALLGSVRGVDEVIFAGGFEPIAHVGVAAALLTVFGLVVLVRDPERRPIGIVLAVTAVLAAIWAVGPRTALFRLSYDVLPGFDFTRAFARWLSVTALVVAIAVGLAVDVIARRRLSAGDRAWGVGIASAAFVAVLLLGLADVIVIPGAATLVPWLIVAMVVTAIVALGATTSPAIAALALVVVVGLELGAASRHSLIDNSTTSTAFDSWDPGPGGQLADRPGLSVAFTDDAFGNTEYLIGGFRPNTNALADVRSLDGYDGGVQVTRRYARLLDDLTGNGNLELPLRNQLPSPLVPDLATGLGIRYAVVDNNRDAITSLPGWVATELRDDRFTVWENPAWVGDAIARDLDDADGALRALVVRQPTPERIEVDVDAVEATAVTLYRQAAPGWSVRVDGAPATLVERDGLFLGVDAPAGASRIEFTYRPGWLTAALLASIAGTVALVVMAIAGAAGRRSLMSSATPADEAPATERTWHRSATPPTRPRSETDHQEPPPTCISSPPPHDGGSPPDSR